MELDDDNASFPAVAEEFQEYEEISNMYSSSNNLKEEISIVYSSWNNATEFPSFSALHENQYNLSRELSSGALDSQSVFPNECRDEDFLIPRNDDSTEDDISILYSSWDNKNKPYSNMQNLGMENVQEVANVDPYSDIPILNDTYKQKLYTDVSSQYMPGFSGFSCNAFGTNSTAQRNVFHDTLRNTAFNHQGSVTTLSDGNVYQNNFPWSETPASLKMEVDAAGQSATTSTFSVGTTSQTKARKYRKRVWLKGSQLYVIPEHQAKKYQRRFAANSGNNMQCPPLRRIILSCRICGEIGFHSFKLLYEHQNACEREILSDPNYSSDMQDTYEDFSSQLAEYLPCPPLKRIIKCDICGEIGFPNLSVLENHKLNCVANVSVGSDGGSFENNTYAEDANVGEIMDFNQNRFGSGTEFSNLTPYEHIAKLACSSCGASQFPSMSSLLLHKLNCTYNCAVPSAYEQSVPANLTFDGVESQNESVDSQYNAGQEPSEGSESVTPYSEFAQYLDVQPVIKFNCYICGDRGFPSMSDLQKHQDACIKRSKAISKSKLPVEKPSPSAKDKVTRQIYRCNLCNAYYEGWTLFGHLLDTHNLLVCLYCFSSFTHADELSVHLFKTHGKEEYFYNSLDHFLATFENGYILVCCRCERMFTEEDRFLDHVCVEKSHLEE